MFTKPTYLVLELPAVMAGMILTLRRRFDPEMAGLPAEITLAGSSGLGVLEEGQEPETVFGVLGSVAAERLPLTTAFVSIERFPETATYWLKPRDPHPFHALQQRLVSAGLRFRPSPFSYTPHCTIARNAPPRDCRLLEGLDVPGEDFPGRNVRISVGGRQGGTASPFYVRPEGG